VDYADSFVPRNERRETFLMATPHPQAATVSIGEVARRLGISKSLAYRLAAANELPVRVLHLGQRRLALRAELDQLLTPVAPSAARTSNAER
jgi:excisionase family DNA binding protein